MNPEIYDNRICFLGEGPLWHPERQQLFWFDIMNNKLLTRSAQGASEENLGEQVSAAGWIDYETLLVASESSLSTLNLETKEYRVLAPLEAENHLNRSNDGRSDPFGGFWVGTMSKIAEEGSGSYWRYYKGELRKVFSYITIPNSICFLPDGSEVFLGDTGSRIIWRQKLDAEGWPKGERRVFLNLGIGTEKANPDGATIDSEGRLWSAQWGSGCLSVYSIDGKLLDVVRLPTRRVTCPTFGGKNLDTLFITSSQEGLSKIEMQSDQYAGMTFSVPSPVSGLEEKAIIL